MVHVMVLVSQLLLLVLVNILFQKLFIYLLQRLSLTIIPTQMLPTFIMFYFLCQLAFSVPTAAKQK